ALPHLRHADLRLEVVEGKYALAENGSAKGGGDDYGFTAGVRVLAGDRALAPGYVGLALGAADVPNLERILKDAVRTAHRRALANAESKAQARGKYGPLGESLADLT